MIVEIDSAGEDDTYEIGRRLGSAVEAGDLVGLVGPLGAGKTCLVRGLAAGMGLAPERVRSPSFTLIATYRGARRTLHHVDLFRLDPSADDRMALREYFHGDAVCVVEWFERLGEHVDHLPIEISYAGSHGRRIRVGPGGDRYRRLLEAVDR